MKNSKIKVGDRVKFINSAFTELVEAIGCPIIGTTGTIEVIGLDCGADAEQNDVIVRNDDSSLSGRMDGTTYVTIEDLEVM